MLRLLLAAVLSAASLSAQNTQLPGSGCTGAPFTSASAAHVGQRFTWGCPICLGTATHFAVLGIRLNPFVPVSPPITCTNAGTCLVACQPLLVVRGAGSGLDVPNDPRLVGACLCVQCACLDLNFNCLTIAGALEVCVQA
jgi:hypothetical protein